MSAAILFYGAAVPDTEIRKLGFQKSGKHEFDSAVETRVKKSGRDPGKPPFGCVLIGHGSYQVSVAILESCLLASGNDATVIPEFTVRPEWHEKLAEYFSFFELGAPQCRWYIDYVDDDAHRGNRLAIAGTVKNRRTEPAAKESTVRAARKNVRGTSSRKTSSKAKNKPPKKSKN